MTKKKTKPSENLVDEHWVTNRWRPAMAWAYMAICLFDFIIAPTGSAILITFYKSSIPVWKSLTLDNGGIIHVAFGAILGVAAWGRTKESVTNTEMYGGFNRGGYEESSYTREEVRIQPRGRQAQQVNSASEDVTIEESELPVLVKEKPPVTSVPQINKDKPRPEL
jgi:hypothetical protein